MCSDGRRTGVSQASPSQARSSKIAASYSGRQRVRSMSSMRRMQRPPASRAASQAVRAENAWPRCSQPVGEGAKRVTKGATRRGLTPAVRRRQTHVLEDGPQEGDFPAQSLLQVLELLEAG